MRNSAIHIFLVVGSILLPFAGSAQTFSYRHFGVEEGLASSTVYDIFQDSKGYMWFATETGVNRFDGYSFTTFTTNDGLAENEVHKLTEDRTGRIWFMPIGGKMSSYKDGRISRFDLLSKHTVLTLFLDRKGDLWFSTLNKTLFKFTPGSDSLIPFRKSDSAHLALIFQDTDGTYWGTNGHYAISFKNRSQIKHYNRLDSRTIGPRYGAVILKTDSNNLILLYGESIHQYNKHGLLRTYPLYGKKGANNMMRDRQNNIWISTRSGVLFYPGGDLTNPKPEVFFPQNIVTCVREDKEGHIWIATLEDGVFQISTENRNYRVYSHIEALNNRRVVQVEGNGTGRIIAGTTEGLVVFLNKNTSSTHKVFFDNPRLKRVKNINFHKDRVFVNRDDGFFIIDPPDRFLKIDAYKSASKSASVYKDTLLFIGSGGGTTVLDARTFKYYGRQARDCRIYNTLTDRSGDRVWMGTGEGLLYYKDTSLVFLKKTIPLLAARINQLAQDNNGTLWLATHEKGLIGFKNGKIINHIRQSDGLSSDICNSVFVDKDQCIWVGTNQGVNKISFAKGTYTNYMIQIINSKKGLISDEINDIYKEGSVVWIATNRGLISMDETDIKPNNVSPPVYLKTLKIWENDTVLLPEYDLSHKQNNLRIGFVGLTYSTPGHVRYRYRMLGVDSAWAFTTSTFVSYPILPPGNYLFEVQASNTDGYWSVEPARMSLHIAHPFYRTTWFIVLSILSAASLIGLLVLLRVRSIKRRAREKSELDKRIAGLEMDALRAQINPHFIFNALNSIQHFISDHDADSAHKYLAKFARLIRLTLEHATKPNIVMAEELDSLELYLNLEALRFSNKFEYSIHVDPRIKTEYTEIPHMLIQPYIENSIWHGLMHKDTPGIIRIEFKIQEDYMLCIIEDNGIGRTKSASIKSHRIDTKNSKSKGMEITRTRIDILNKMRVDKAGKETTVEIVDLYNNQQESIGTKVEIMFPLLT